MKIYYKKTEEEAPELSELLKEAKMEFDEAWLQEAEKQMPEGMELRLQETIGRLAAEEAKPKQIGNRIWFRAAACVLAILVLGIGYRLSNPAESVFTDTCQTPEEAQQQLERALTMIQSYSSKGLQMAEDNCQPLQGKTSAGLSKYISFE